MMTAFRSAGPPTLAVATATSGASRLAGSGATRRRGYESLIERLRTALALVRRAAADGSTAAPDGQFEIRPLLGLVVAFWAVVVGVDFINDWLLAGLVTEIRPISRVAIDMGVWWGLWIALVPPLLLIAARLDPERIGLRRSAAIHFALSLAVGLLHFVAAAWAFELFDSSADDPAARVRRWIAVFTLSQSLTYWGFVGVLYAGHFWRRARTVVVRSAGLERKADRLARVTAEARLRALRRELETHLLLNSLNNLGGLVRQGRSEDTLRAIRGMGDLVRSAAEDGTAVQVTLARELELLGRYLELVEGIRDEARVHVRVDPGLDRALVPPLLLQPLVENALVHGRGPVDVRARWTGTAVRLEVSNEVPPGTRGPRPGREGTGLAATRARLELLHGPAASLRVTTAGGRVRVLVELPLVAE